MGVLPNDRRDEYGGNLENRVRIVKEILEEVKEAVGHRCAVATRFAVDSGLSDSNTEQGDEAREMVSLLAELPDLWDVVIDDYSIEMGPSRFTEEGGMEHFVSYVKQVTSKPVVGVGGFTTPDTMARMIKKGILDFIGAARPSIADPFLPNKIKEGREDEIRECIGCNICYAHDDMGAPIRCTQNPTMGEEWRRDWHPEHVPEKTSDEAVLIVGSGPAGLEAAYILGKRGYPVILAEAGTELGGRISRESRLPTLSEVARVRDYRIQRLQQMPNVEIYMDSLLTAENVREFAFPRVIIATGAKWRSDGMGRSFPLPLSSYVQENLFTPDDLMDGKALPTSKQVVVFDDDHYYMGAVLAEHLHILGKEVTYVTSAGRVADWSEHTGEQYQTHQRLLSLGVKVIVNKTVCAFDGASVTLECIYSEEKETLEAGIFVPVTSRRANDELYQDLHNDTEKLKDAGINQLLRIGDCEAPSIIASAIYAGHHIGRTIDDPESLDVPFKRDRALI